MSFAHKVVLWMMQRRGYLGKTEQKAEFFFTRPKCTSQIWKSALIGLRFLPLKSADVRGAGTRERKQGK